MHFLMMSKRPRNASLIQCIGACYTRTFDVHGSVHLGNVYVQLNVQLDVLFICILYSSVLLALHVSGAVCTHPQKHELSRPAVGV
jgi:hypothetical protein